MCGSAAQAVCGRTVLWWNSFPQHGSVAAIEPTASDSRHSGHSAGEVTRLVGMRSRPVAAVRGLATRSCCTTFWYSRPASSISPALQPNSRPSFENRSRT